MDVINLSNLVKADELDSNLILDVPESIGLKIQNYIKNGEYDSLNIEILQQLNDNFGLEESRKLLFKVNNIYYPATIIDLPCLIESQKTLDFKTFYKSSDICQKLYVHENPIDNPDDLSFYEPLKCQEEIFKSLLWTKDPDHLYKSKHGITLYTKNIRERRFKRKKKYNKDDIAVTCKKIKNIIDNGAANFEKSLVENNEKSEKPNIISFGFNNNDDSNDINFSLNTSSSNINSNTNINNITNTNKTKTNSITSLSQSQINNNNSNSSKKAKKTDKNNGINNNITTEKSLINTDNTTLILNENKENDYNSKSDAKFDAEKERIANEFNKLKSDYKKIKELLSTNPSEDLQIKKKELKKTLKTLKKEFKKYNQDYKDDDSN